MGETSGVARSGTQVLLSSSSAVQLGRKCSSDTCLSREGVGVVAGAKPFSRCGGCRSVWYCSGHCQATHWKRGHRDKCKQLAAAYLAERQAENEAIAQALTEKGKAKRVEKEKKGVEKEIEKEIENEVEKVNINEALENGQNKDEVNVKLEKEEEEEAAVKGAPIVKLEEEKMILYELD
mmetsp:Transcript_16985/g.30849  ORF Transcript_16985/g.30849 Transcript_16985/m.30849 type:complete len:179 (+) Transcript_16985:301-837(+)